MHDVGLAVDEEGALGPGLGVPGQKLVAIGVSREAVDGVNMSSYRDFLAENMNFLGAVDDTPSEGSPGGVADEDDLACFMLVDKGARRRRNAIP